MVSEEAKQKSEDYKAEGNTLFQEKKYDEAIEAYSNAIKNDNSNHVFYSFLHFRKVGWYTAHQFHRGIGLVLHGAFGPTENEKLHKIKHNFALL